VGAHKKKHKQGNESTVTTLSLLIVVIMSAAIVMLSMKEDHRDLPAVTLNTLQQVEMMPVPLPEKPSSLQTELAQQTEVVTASTTAAKRSPPTPEEERMAEITMRFEQAVVMLHARQYEHAATALHRVMTLAPRMPEVYVNMGYAKLGQALPQEALVFFETATQLKPEQANAYWGMAIALESGGDLAGALGAMRTYLHLSSGDDNFARRARSALWEWEEALARGPLPEAEKEFLERGALQWESRNTPRDDAGSGEQALQVQPIQ